MDFDYLEFRLHAIKRMFERGISASDARQVVKQGTVIEEYPTDTPYPSLLILGFVRGRALHVMVAVDQKARRAIIVTVYEPDPLKWEPGFRRRKG